MQGYCVEIYLIEYLLLPGVGKSVGNVGGYCGKFQERGG